MSKNKHSENTHEVIESVLTLTEQRDELALLSCLPGIILEMLPGVETALVWLIPGAERGQWVSDASRPLPQPMFTIADWLLEVMVELSSEMPNKQLDQDGQNYLICSLGILEGRRKAIAIRQPKWTSSDLRTAQGMINIHANYAKLLFDSERDTLTGLYNRKKMEQKMSELLLARSGGFKREQDQGKDDYLAVFDIDHFKRVNDNFGHLIGDEVLLIFAGLVRNALRDVDWVFRYGGEEFVALIKGVTPEVIVKILERIRIKVQNHPFPQVGQITISTGYTVIADQALPPHVFEEADKALYYAKEHGRNQVCSYRDLVNSGELTIEDHITGSIELF